jgi:hypothetical protein
MKIIFNPHLFQVDYKIREDLLSIAHVFQLNTNLFLLNDDDLIFKNLKIFGASYLIDLHLF